MNLELLSKESTVIIKQSVERLLLVFLLTGIAGPVFAQPRYAGAGSDPPANMAETQRRGLGTETITLDELLHTAMESNPAIQASRHSGGRRGGTSHNQSPQKVECCFSGTPCGALRGARRP